MIFDNGLKLCSEGLGNLASRTSLTVGDHAFELACDKFVNSGELIHDIAEVKEELKATVQAQDDKTKVFLCATDRQLANA